MLIKLFKWLNDRLTQVKKSGSSNFLCWLLAQSELIFYLTFSFLKRQQYAQFRLSLHCTPGECAIQTEVVTAVAQCGHIFCFYFFSWTMHFLTWANVWSRLLQHFAFQGCAVHTGLQPLTTCGRASQPWDYYPGQNLLVVGTICAL